MGKAAGAQVYLDLGGQNGHPVSHSGPPKKGGLITTAGSQLVNAFLDRAHGTELGEAKIENVRGYSNKPFWMEMESRRCNAKYGVSLLHHFTRRCHALLNLDGGGIES